MTVDNLVHVFAGTLWCTAFVGANLLQFGFTGYCPVASILKKLGVKERYASVG